MSLVPYVKFVVFNSNNLKGILVLGVYSKTLLKYLSSLGIKHFVYKHETIDEIV